MIQLDTLTPNPTNPRRISAAALERLCASIERDPVFMELRPIIIDEHRVILGGNQRYKACKELGMVQVPDGWVRSGKFNAEQRKRFIVVDNAPEGMAGEWDLDLLAVDWQLPELEDIGFDVGVFSVPGFEPGTQEEQGQLDKLSALMVHCPDCGKEFDAREQG